MRQGVVHKAGAPQLAVGFVKVAPAQCLLYALHRAVFDLPADDVGADGSADAVDTGTGHDKGVTSGVFDLHLADAAAVGPAR